MRRTASSSTAFRARCRRPRRSTGLLKDKGLKLDSVIELRVNEAVLLRRVETRIAEMQARGEAVRADDNAEALAKRLDAYRAQTEPLVHYYGDKRALATVDGMASIDEVTAQISRILEVQAAAGRRKAAKKARQSGQKGGRDGQIGPQRPQSLAKRPRSQGRQKGQERPPRRRASQGQSEGRNPQGGQGQKDRPKGHQKGQESRAKGRKRLTKRR